MTITFTSSEVTLIGSPLESSLIDDCAEIVIDIKQAKQLMEDLRVAIELSKDF